MKRLLIVVLLLLAGACATDAGLRESQRLALYSAHAGAPLPNFRFFGRLDGWTPLGDSALAVWTRPNQAYLLELNGRCPDLEFASAITLSSQLSSVYARFDKVLPLGPAPGVSPMPCYIRQIRPLDVASLKAAEREIRRSAATSARED